MTVFHHLLLWQDFHWGHWEISCTCTCSSNSSHVLWKDPGSDLQQTLFSQPCSISFLTQPMPIYFICHQSRVALQSRCCASTLTLIRCLVSRDKMLLHWAMCHYSSFWSFPAVNTSSLKTKTLEQVDEGYTDEPFNLKPHPWSHPKGTESLALIKQSYEHTACAAFSYCSWASPS